jgi:hypothetical protein
MNHESANNGSRDTSVIIVNRIQVVTPNKLASIPSKNFLLSEAYQLDIEHIQLTVQWEPGINRPRRGTEN